MMKRKRTSNKPSHFSLLQGKVLWFMLLFLAQNVLAQITLSEGATLYSDQAKIIVDQTDSLAIGEQNISKIYISSGVQIYSFNSDVNYETADIVPFDFIKSESKKQLAVKIEKQSLDKALREVIDQIKDEIILTQKLIDISKSEFNFSNAGNSPKIIVPGSHNIANQIFKSENHKTSLVFGWTEMISVYFKITELLTTQNKSAFSVRPPPFLA